MKEKLLSIGDDSWIEDDQGERVYKVDGKAMRIRDTFVLEDRDGNEVAKIQERKLTVRDTMKIERDGDTVATVHKALVGFRDRFRVEVEDGEDLKIHGNIVDHEYEIERDGDAIAKRVEEVVPRPRHLRRRDPRRRGRAADARPHRRARRDGPPLGPGAQNPSASKAASRRSSSS